MIQSGCILFYVITLGTLLEEMPIWDRSLKSSLCIEVLRAQDHTETVVIVAIAIVVVSIEYSGIGFIVVIAPAFEEWIAGIHKVRVVQFNP